VSSLHPAVAAIGQGFRALGAATPSTFKHKAELLLQPNFPGERVGVVVVDAIRCSTTITAMFAAEAAAVSIREKNTRGPDADAAGKVAARLGLELVLAGELHGGPIPGGVLGNSPCEVRPDLVRGKMVLFSSTNFGATFNEVMSWSRGFEAAGGQSFVAVATFANVDAVVAVLRREALDRVVVATGGFYDCISREDMVAGGDLFIGLGFDDREIDDEARAMVDAARACPSDVDRIASFGRDWIGRALVQFHHEADVAAVVTGEGIAPPIYAAMKTLVPVARHIDGVPVITIERRNA
jgi:phosphosulfolactate phosphohydrolase-like enzyme